MKKEYDVYKEAALAGACNDWFAGDGGTLVDMYKRNIDWCVYKQFPDMEYMLDFDGELTEKGVFNHKRYLRYTANQDMVLNNSYMHIIVPENAFLDIYCARESNAVIELKHGAKLFLDIHNNSMVNLVSKSGSVCYVYKYGGEFNHTGDGKIIVKERTYKEDWEYDSDKEE